MTFDDAVRYNMARHGLAKKLATIVTELVRQYQDVHGLDVDGALGPKTEGLFAPPIVQSSDFTIDANGILSGAGVEVMLMDPSWRYAKLKTPKSRPLAIVAHYTATDPGTARNMARNRQRQIGPDDRNASWHVSIETDGSVIQMAPFTTGCWHAGGATAKPIAGIGPANRVSVGVELVGYGSSFPEAQVTAAAKLWRALVLTYQIPRALAMITHQSLDPTRKTDPGPVWIGEHADRVLDFAFDR